MEIESWSNKTSAQTDATPIRKRSYNEAINVLSLVSLLVSLQGHSIVGTWLQVKGEPWAYHIDRVTFTRAGQFTFHASIRDEHGKMVEEASAQGKYAVTGNRVTMKYTKVSTYPAKSSLPTKPVVVPITWEEDGHLNMDLLNDHREFKRVSKSN